MAKTKKPVRKLVEVCHAHHAQLMAIHDACKKAEQMVPTVPFLLRHAIEHGIAETTKRYTPKNGQAQVSQD